MDYYKVENLTSMSSGAAHTCGLRVNGTAVCWGRDWEAQATAPRSIYTTLEAERHYSCGVLTLGGIECWGQEPSPVPGRIKNGEYVDVALEGV